MLVNTMNADDIYKELMRDFHGVVKSKIFGAGKIFRGELTRQKLTEGTRTISVKTPQRNDWSIFFRLFEKHVDFAFYVKAWDKIGMVVYMIEFLQEDHGEEYYVVKFNTHFFKRYNERMNLELKDPGQVIKHFYRNNTSRKLGQTEILDDGTRLIHFVFNDGVGIGWQDDARKTIHVKTFISNDTLGGTLKSMVEHVRSDGEDRLFEISLSEENNVNKIY